MRPYEVMVIFDASADPSAIQGVVDRILETIRSTGGTPGTVDRWGRRPFAYEVKHRREGYYVLIEFTSETPTVRANDGTPGTVDRWGRRPFAYEVKHRREGYYVLIDLAGTSQTVNELDRMLALADEVLRHKVIRLPDKKLQTAPADTAPDSANAGSSKN